MRMDCCGCQDVSVRTLKKIARRGRRDTSGPMAATSGWTFVGAAVTPNGDGRSRRSWSDLRSTGGRGSQSQVFQWVVTISGQPDFPKQPRSNPRNRLGNPAGAFPRAARYDPPPVEGRAVRRPQHVLDDLAPGIEQPEASGQREERQGSSVAQDPAPRACEPRTRMRRDANLGPP